MHVLVRERGWEHPGPTGVNIIQSGKEEVVYQGRGSYRREGRRLDFHRRSGVYLLASAPSFCSPPWKPQNKTTTTLSEGSFSAFLQKLEAHLGFAQGVFQGAAALLGPGERPVPARLVETAKTSELEGADGWSLHPRLLGEEGGQAAAPPEADAAYLWSSELPGKGSTTEA